MRGVFLCTALLYSAACYGSPELEVRVCGDVAVPAQIDGLRISILNEAWMEISAGVLSLEDLESGVSTPLPIAWGLPAPHGEVWIRAAGLLDGVEVARFERLVPKSEDVDRVGTVLSVECYSVVCPLGQTCVGGECVLAPRTDDPPHCGGPE